MIGLQFNGTTTPIARLPRHGLARAWLRAHRRERQAVRRRQGVRRRPLGLLVDPADAQPVHDELLIERLALAAPHLAQEVLLVGDLGEVHPHPLGRPVDVARRNLRLGVKATPESPKSAGTAFQVASAFGSSPRRAPIFRAVAVTMDSIMKPVLGTPTGTGLGPTGGMAMQTPTRRFRGTPCSAACGPPSTKPRGLVSPSMSRTAPTPRNAGSIMEKTNGNSTKPSNT